VTDDGLNAGDCSGVPEADYAKRNVAKAAQFKVLWIS